MRLLLKNWKAVFLCCNKERKFENDAGDKVGIGLGLDGNSHFHAANHKDRLDQA